MVRQHHRYESIKFLSFLFLLRDLIFKSRISLLGIIAISIYCIFVIPQNATLFWYPHTGADIWFNFLFGVCVLIMVKALQHIISFTLKPCFIIVILCHLLDVCAFVGKLLVVAVIITLCGTPWLNRYQMSSWIMSIVCAFLFLYYCDGGFHTIIKGHVRR